MKNLRKIMIFLFSIITLFIVVYVATVKLYPSFGGDLTSNQKDQRKLLQTSRITLATKKYK